MQFRPPAWGNQIHSVSCLFCSLSLALMFRADFQPSRLYNEQQTATCAKLDTDSVSRLASNALRLRVLSAL